MRTPSHSVASRLAGAALALVTAVAVAQPAQAQDTGTLQFNAGGQLAFTGPYGPPDIGRLQGTLLTLNGATVNEPVDLFCVDLLHNVTFGLSGWDVYLTNLGVGDVSKTRQAGQFGDVLERYRRQAWLVDQYATVATLADSAGIQAAMWLQFESSISPYTYATTDEADATAFWYGAVDAFAMSSDFVTYDWSRFTVFTDVNAVGLGSQDFHGYQELIAAESFGTTNTAPEPASLALLATGMAALGVAVRRRRAARAPDA